MNSNSSPKQQSRARESFAEKKNELPAFAPSRRRPVPRNASENRSETCARAALAGGLMLGTSFAAEAAAPSQESAPALFNRGNALVREGKPGPAILAYERAQQLAPRDPAIAVNLQAVRDTAGLAAPMAAWWQSAARALTMNEWAWSGSLALAFVCGATFLSRLLPTRLRQPVKALERGVRSGRADFHHRALAALARTQPRRRAEFPCHRANRARRKCRTGVFPGRG